MFCSENRLANSPETVFAEMRTHRTFNETSLPRTGLGQQLWVSVRECHHFIWLLNLATGRSAVSTPGGSTVAGLGSYCIGCPEASTPLPVPHGWISVLSRPALTVGSSFVNLAVCSIPTRKMATPRSSP